MRRLVAQRALTPEHRRTGLRIDPPSVKVVVDRGRLDDQAHDARHSADAVADALTRLRNCAVVVRLCGHVVILDQADDITEGRLATGHEYISGHDVAYQTAHGAPHVTCADPAAGASQLLERRPGPGGP